MGVLESTSYTIVNDIFSVLPGNELVINVFSVLFTLLPLQMQLMDSCRCGTGDVRRTCWGPVAGGGTGELGVTWPGWQRGRGPPRAVAESSYLLPR